MSISKIVFNNESFIDLTSDTVDEQVLHDDFTAISNDGTEIVGEEPYPSLENDIIEKTLSGTYTNTKLTSLADYAFMGQSQLTDINIGKITTIPQYAFCGCTLLQNVSDISNVTSIGTYAFQNCKALQTMFLPLANGGSYTGNAFQNCIQLETVVLPSWRSQIFNYFFQGCTNLRAVDFGVPNMPWSTNDFRDIAAAVFSNCTKLQTLVIRMTTRTVALNGGVGVFSNTPFAEGGIGGILYVPEAKINDYQSATNWSTILGYENNQILPIEGSQYENYYADGTPIPTQQS